jgi:ABC-2 type transport system ATP-binding protein
MDEAEQLCDRIAIMDNGKIVASGTVDELKRKVAHQTGKLGPSMEDVYMTLTGHELSHEMAVASVA